MHMQNIVVKSTGIISLVVLFSLAGFGCIRTPQSMQKDVEKKTASWSTYANKTYGFRIKYPDTANVVQQTDEYLSLLYFSGYPPEGDIMLRVLQNPKKYSLEEFYQHASEVSEMQRNGFNHIVKKKQLADEVSEISIAGRTWLKMIHEINEVEFLTYAMRREPMGEIIELTDSGDHPMANILFRKMLATFQ